MNKHQRMPITIGLLTVALLITFQVLWAYQIDHAKLADAKVFSSLNWDFFLNSQLLLQLIGFLALFVLLHLSVSWLIYLYAQALSLCLNKQIQLFERIKFYTYSVLLHIAVLLLLNSWLFPNSKFAKGLFFGETATLILLFIYLASLLFLLKAQILKPLVLIGIIWLIPVLYNLDIGNKSHQENQEKPNIFIFGIDSLRPDHTNPQQPKQSPTPFLSQQLANSVNFTQAYTPLARTFPAWMSILTGHYPHEHKAQYNLTNYKRLLPINTLAKTLQNQGYTSMYASDEKRFSNIKKELGFDYLIGPSMGGNDFVIGQFADFPLSNLFSLLPLAQAAMPFVVNNRAAAYAYNPESASLSFAKQIIKKSGGAPIFIAVHFCLPHYPFSWRTSPIKELDASYAQAASMADKQLNILYTNLKQAGLINKHSLQIFISDHGEALNQDKSHWQNPNGKHIRQMSYGHGTDVKQLSQYHVVMAAQSATLTAKNNKNLSSLTLLKEGILKWQLNPSQFKTKPIKWVRFENGYTPTALQQASPQLGKLLFNAARFYGLNPQAHLVLKPEAYQHLLKTKDYAYFNGTHLYAQMNQNWFQINTQNKQIIPYKQSNTMQAVGALFCKNHTGCPIKQLE